MSSFDLQITLLEDAVFSERTATEGGHRGLNYIPGATLLGAAARRLYPELSREDAFTLFHSGKVRFGNGLPLDETGAVAYPIPFCWHSVKGEEFAKDGLFLGDKIWNLGVVELPKDKQSAQLRACFVTSAGGEVKPINNLRMKTSIDAKTGRAKEHALFGYDALPAGSRFRASIAVDKGVTAGLAQRLQTVLTEGSLLLGRSRSAEYGRAEAVTGEFSVLPHSAQETPNTITLWLLSDLAAVDELGQPSLFPQPDWLGLPKGRLIAEKSYIRTRRYSPWNAYRGGPDLERQVILQGSVLVFQLDVPFEKKHQQRIEAGLGAFREAGLGRVWLEPKLLKTAHPEFGPELDKPVPGKEQNPEWSETDLIRWLKSQQSQKSNRQSDRHQARVLAEHYRSLLGSARKLKGLEETIAIGPSASQWGSVGEAAKIARNNDEMLRLLFDENNGRCKFKAPGWRDEFYNDDSAENRIDSFAGWIRQVLGKAPDRRLLQHLTREIQAILKR